MSPTRRDIAHRPRRRTLAAAALVGATGLVLSGCQISVNLTYYTDTIVDCTDHVLEVRTKSGQTFREAAEWIYDAYDDTYDDTVLRWEVTDSWFDPTVGVVPLAEGEITVRDWKDATSFATPFEDRRIQNPLHLVVWDGSTPSVVGEGGCPEADVQVSTWLPHNTELDDELPVFYVSAAAGAEAAAEPDTSLLEIGGTAEPTGFTISRYADNSEYIYVVTVTGVARDGTVTLTVPPGYGRDVWGATNRSGQTATMTLDRTPPEIAAAPDIDAGFAPLDATEKVVSFATPEATDPHLAGPASCTPASGAAFPVGTTTVTCTAADLAGNVASTHFDVTVAAAPRSAHSLVVTGPATATEGDAATFSVEVLNSQGESLGAPTGGVTLTSSVAADAVSGDRIVFGFDPAAIGGSSTRTITATLDDAPGVRGSTTVEVASTAAAIRIRAPQGATPSVDQGGSITFAIDALDRDGTPLGDASRHVVLTSDVPSDVVDGATVTFPHASPHVITATAVGDPTLTASVLVEVIPARAPAAVAATGPTDAIPVLMTSAALLLGGALLVTQRRRASGSTTGTRGAHD